ncbi:hypothetical protein CXB51_004999 [Gossypium anomalum]|uniref:DUF1664 domain-containing protein n=1 Tax=Gossypium anomalum TaxID=47600 RepID=A0A8J5ZF98_9ROSI|nr:hypothetical protein CXB51_004999 [Gossypium anomalum]
MALPIGKLSILVGAGIVGSILAKEGHMPNLSDFVSGAFKFAFRQLKHDDSTPSGNKPRNDYLMAQVNSLRQELQILASNRPVTIVTGRGSGSSKYRIIIVVVVVGYGYLWWKGWRLPDMMFATRRSLSDARDAIAKQLDSATRRHLSSRIEGVDNHLNEIADIAATTQDEVSLLQDKSKMLNSNVHSVRYVVQTLESKINRIEGKQTGSLPPIVPVDLPAPDSNGTHMVKRSPRNAVSASGLKEVGESSSNDVGNGKATSENKTNGSSSSSGFSGMMFSGGNGSFLTRTCSATNAVPQQM